VRSVRHAVEPLHTPLCPLCVAASGDAGPPQLLLASVASSLVAPPPSRAASTKRRGGGGSSSSSGGRGDSILDADGNAVRLLVADEVRLLRRRLVEHAAAGDATLTVAVCGHPACGEAWAMRAVEHAAAVSAAEPTLRCPVCRGATCIKCQGVAHGSGSGGSGGAAAAAPACPLADTSAADALAARQLQAMGAQPCWRCSERMVHYRNEGCHRMVCPSCRARMCYVCGREPHDARCRCPIVCNDRCVCQPRPRGVAALEGADEDEDGDGTAQFDSDSEVGDGDSEEDDGRADDDSEDDQVPAWVAAAVEEHYTADMLLAVAYSLLARPGIDEVPAGVVERIASRELVTAEAVILALAEEGS
jgi:hypothetical protein